MYRVACYMQESNQVSMWWTGRGFSSSKSRAKVYDKKSDANRAKTLIQKNYGKSQYEIFVHSDHI